MNFFHNAFVKKFKLGFGALAVVGIICILIFLALAQFASRGAARIFNRQMEMQDMFRGHITVESMMANIKGDVSFENLLWKDEQGETILLIPEGTFHARPWDVVTRNFKSTTVQELTLKNAFISVRFDEDMQVDFLKQRPGRRTERRPDGPDTRKKEGDIGNLAQRQLKNFNRNGRKLRAKIVFENCRLETRYRKRHYILNNVNMELDLDTSSLSHIELSTGKFGGTMRGGGLTISGDIDFKPETPEIVLDVALRRVDPSSLGFGMNIHDMMTVVAKITGPITGPQGRGTVRMQELHIPALNFTDVIGDVTYSDSLFRFSDVHAKIFNGNLVARGDYHLDTRRYNIYGKGSKIDSKLALNNMKFSCMVDLDLILRCNGDPKSILTYGDFKSGPGRYGIIPFDRLQGRFDNRYKELNFYDVEILLPIGKISTDAFSVVEGKLHLGPISMLDYDSGKVISIKAKNER